MFTGCQYLVIVGSLLLPIGSWFALPKCNCHGNNYSMIKKLRHEAEALKFQESEANCDSYVKMGRPLTWSETITEHLGAFLGVSTNNLTHKS